MLHIPTSCDELSEEDLVDLHQRYPAMIERIEQRYPIGKGHHYYRPQLRVRNGAAVFCPICNEKLQYRDLRIVTRRIDGIHREIYLLERCLCAHCRGCKGQEYHMLYPDEVMEGFRYAEDTLEMAIDELRSEKEAADNGLDRLVRDGQKGALSERKEAGFAEIPVFDPADRKPADKRTQACVSSTQPCTEQIDEKTLHRWFRWYRAFRTPLLLALSLTRAVSGILANSAGIPVGRIVAACQRCHHWLRSAMSVVWLWRIPTRMEIVLKD